MNFVLTPVSTDVVWVQGKLLVEFSDGQLREYTHYGRPTDSTTWCGRDLGRFTSLTHDQLVELCRDHNRQHLADCSHNLHLDKVRRLGHDYQARGYR